METKTLTNKRRGYTLNRKTSIWTAVILILAVPVVTYYLWTRGFAYLNFSREVYTDYFWYRAPWLLIHVILGLVATLVGPFQFIESFRQKNLTLHRNMGKVYVVSIVISTFISFYLGYTAQLGLVYAIGLTGLGCVWLISTLMAYFSIYRKNIQIHKEWMVRSYVLTLSFVSFRFVEDLMALIDFSTFLERKVIMAWASWAFPFFLTEVVLQFRKLTKKV